MSAATSTTHYMVALRDFFTAENWPPMSLALRQDQHIWEAVVDTELGRRALAELPAEYVAWKPASLALLDLHSELSPQMIAEQPEKSISNALRQSADDSYHNWIKEPLKDQLSLARAGLLALSIRLQASDNDWQALDPALVAGFQQRPQHYRTILACLLGMIPNPAEFMRWLCAQGEAKLAIHAFLCNPAASSDQIESLAQLLQGLPVLKQLATLQAVKAQRSELAAALAKQLPMEAVALHSITGQASAELRSQASTEMDGYLELIAALRQRAAGQRLAGEPAQAIAPLTEALNLTKGIQAHLAAQLGHAARENEDAQASLEAWKQAVQLAPENGSYSAELAFALIEAGRLADAQAYLSARQTESADLVHPAHDLASAILARQSGENETARRTMERAVEYVEQQPTSGWELSEAHQVEFTRLLLELNLFKPAAQVTRIFLNERPNHALLLAHQAKAELMIGHAQPAVSAAYAALTTHPHDLGLKQLLIASLEANEDWAEALREREKMLALQADDQGEAQRSLPVVEWISLANCALNAGQPERAAQACQQGLLQEPENGLLYGLLGRAAFASGDAALALEQLEKATQLSPDEAEPWLALAQVYQQTGNPAQAVEVLRAASMATPNFAEVHLSLGEAYLEEKSPTQALEAFRTAADIVAAEQELRQKIGKAKGLQDITGSFSALASRVALRYGETLYELGHLEEARAALEPAYRTSKTQKSHIDPGLAYTYAKTLVSLGQSRLALEPFTRVIEANPADYTPYLDYARCLLNAAPEKAALAAPHLEHVLAQVPTFSAEYEEAQALLADALAGSGEYAKAKDTYRLALESQLAQEPAWHARLSLGLGRVSLALGQFETALAALQEADQADPQNSSVQRSLVEAYLATGLIDEALQAARMALTINPNDLDTLIWFTNHLQDLFQQTHDAQLQAEVENALAQAVELAPQRIDLRVRLGQLQLQEGQPEVARQTLGRIAVLANQSLDCSDHSCLPILEALYQAARILRDLQDFEPAAAILQRGISLGYASEELAASVDEHHAFIAKMQTELGSIYHETGNLAAALQSINDAVVMQPGNPLLYQQRANLLIEAGQNFEALKCIEAALNLEPVQPDQAEDLKRGELHLHAARILYAIGDLPRALFHAENASEYGCPSGRLLAAEILHAMLQFEQAMQRLNQVESEALDGSASRLSIACLNAEMALETNEGDFAAQAIAAVCQLDPQDPRGLAAQARWITRQGDHFKALKTLQAALEGLKAFQPESKSQPASQAEVPLATLRAIGEAAVDLAQWDVALYFLREVAYLAPQEPISYLQLARSMVLRAEAQQLYSELDVIQHAPGALALSQETRLAFENAIHSAQTKFFQWKEANARQASHPQLNSMAAQAQDLLKRWLARGLAVFQPGPESLQRLQEYALGADDSAAIVAAMGHSAARNTALQFAQTSQHTSRILLQLALILKDKSPRQALVTANAAINQLDSQPVQHPEDVPLLYYLQAQLTFQMGLQATEFETARRAIATALTAWPEEPRWHALAAQIYLKINAAAQSDEITATIHHLQQACRLEPLNPQHALHLGETYFLSGNLEEAIQTLEQAAQLAPEDPEIWMAMAKALQAHGDLEQAAAYAERAIESCADNQEALLLRAEIALQTNNPRGAQSRAQAVIHNQPSNPRALQILAKALQGLNRPAEALDTLEKVIPLVADPRQLLLERVELIQQAHGEAKGLEALQALAHQYPQEALILAPLAEAQFRSGQAQEGLNNAITALHLQPSPLAGEVQARLHLLVGNQFHRMGQLDQAISHLVEATQAQPASVEAYLELGQTYQERRQQAQALKAYERAIEIARDDPRPYFQAGMALKESKDYQNAESMLKRAADLAPEDVTIHRMLGAVVALNLVHNRLKMSSNR